MTLLELFIMLLKYKAGDILNVKFKSLITVRLTRVIVIPTLRFDSAFLAENYIL